MDNQFSWIQKSGKSSTCVRDDHRKRCDVSKHTIHLWMNLWSTPSHLKPLRTPLPSIDRFQYSSNTPAFAPKYRYRAIHHSAETVSFPRRFALQFRSAKAAPFPLFLPLGSVRESLDLPAECEPSDRPRWANSAARCFLSGRFEPAFLESHVRLLGVGLAEDGNRCSLKRSGDRFGIGEIGDTPYWVEGKVLAVLNRALLNKRKRKENIQYCARTDSK